MQYSRCTMAGCCIVLVLLSFVILAPNLCGVLQKTGSTSAVKRRSVADQEQLQPTVYADDDIDIPHCGEDESCAGRCGSPANESESYRCFCDHRCTFFKDCCMDFDELCSKFKTENTELKGGTKSPQYDPMSGFDTSVADSEDPTSESSLGSQVDVDCIGLDEFTGGMIWMKSNCDPRWTDSRMAELCADVDSGDTLARLPVQGTDGFTYRNMYCAQCNFVIVNYFYWIGMSACYHEPPADAGTNMTSLAIYLMSSCKTRIDEPKVTDIAKARFCLQNIDWCNPELVEQIGGEFEEFVKRCKMEYQGLVKGESEAGIPVIYKNPFCALCNGVQRSEMSCDVPTLTRYSTDDVSYYDYFTDVESPNTKDIAADLPKPSYVVITNYNIKNGSNVMILRTDGSNELVPVDLKCPDTEVYDPYIGECRPTYCAIGYVMCNNKCIREPIPTQSSDPLYTPDASIEMTFTITIKFTWFVDDSGEFKDPTDGVLPFPVNGSFNDTNDGINVRTYVIGRSNITMDLAEVIEFQGILDQASQNDTLDDASRFWLSVLSFEMQALQVNVAGHVFNIDSNTVEDFITSLKGNTNELASFLEQCPDGVKNVYSRRQLVVNEYPDGDCLSVQIRNTSVSYACSCWLFLKNVDVSDGDAGEEGFTTAVVCEDQTPMLDPSCVRVKYNTSEYIMENSTVICTNGKQYGPGEYERAADGRVFVCSDFDNIIETKYVVHFNFTKGQNIIAMVGVGLSTTCLSATLLTYVLFKELRTLPGMNLMTLAVILLINDWTFLFGLYATDNQTFCRAVAVFLHFICLCQFFWGNVIAYDVYKTFGRKRLTKVNLKTSQRKQYLRYAIYAWGMPVLIVSISAILDFCKCTLLDVDYGLYFSCWISDPIAYSVFFGVPMLVTNAANLIMFVVTVCNLRRYHRKSAVISGNTNTHNHLALCAKLATVMGFAWNLAFVASILHNTILWYFFFVFYFLQGVFMFLSYIFNRRVYRMYLKRFCRERVSSVTSVGHPRARSRPPSVASQVPLASRSPLPSTSRNPSFDEDLIDQPILQHLTDLTSHAEASPVPPRRQIYRQKSNSCSVAHISGSKNLPSEGLMHRVSVGEGIRHLRTSSFDSAALYTSSADTSDISPLQMRQFNTGTANVAFSSSDEFSSDDDDVFQPAYYFTEC